LRKGGKRMLESGLLKYIFTTPGIGGLVVITVFTTLLISYGLTIKWISKAGKREEECKR